MAFKKFEEVNIFEGIYNVMISFKENQTPIGELYYNFGKPTGSDEAYKFLLSSMIKNGGLNIFNQLVEVKGYNSFSDYLLILAIHKGNEELNKELNDLFEFHIEEVSEEEMKKRTDEDKKFVEELDKEDEA